MTAKVEIGELGRVETEVAVPAAALWAVLTDFAHPQRLVPSINSCTVVGEGLGTIRTVKSSRGLTIHERLVECDAAIMRLAYEVLDHGDMPFAGITAYRATVTLTPLAADRTAISWHADGAAAGPPEAVAAFLRGLYGVAIENLAAVALAESTQA